MKKIALILAVVLITAFLDINSQTKNVTIDQRLNNGQQVGILKKWEGSYWSNTFNPGTVFSFPINSNQTILGDQTIHSNQKYNNWNGGFSNVRNHRSFLISSDTDELKSNFLPNATGVTIKTSLEGTNTTGGVVKFSDPWFIDYQDGQFGNQLRNRGMNEAFPRERSSPFYPNAYTYYEYGQKYNGVFLDQPMVSGRSYYKVSVPEEQTISVHGQNRKFYRYKWDGSGVNYEDANSMETGVVFNSSISVATAVLKGELLSNTEDAITNNSQRKTIKTAEGHYILLYESMDGVWLHSKPLNSPSVEFLIDINSKNPSIDYLGNTIAIVYEKTESNQLKLCYKILSALTLGIEYETQFTINTSSSYWGNAKPVIVIGSNNQHLIVFKPNTNSGLKYYLRSRSNNYIWVWSSEYQVENTDMNTANWSIARGYVEQYHFAFQQGESAIYYMHADPKSHNELRFCSLNNLSTGSGYLYNRYPSLIVMNDNYARVTWQGTRYEEEQRMDLRKVKKGEEQNSSEGTEITRIVFKSSDFNYFWSFGNNTGKPNINRHSTAYAVAWSENNGSSVKFIDQISNNIIVKTISNISGKDVQLTNGSSLSDMYAVSLKTTAAPYYFMKSNSLNTFNKPNLLTISSGREGVVYNEGAEFYFAIGDIKVNGNNTDFVEIPDSVKTLDLSLLNEYLRSQTISVDNTSQLLYSVQYGMIDSASTKNYLQTGKTITFGVELVDAITNNVLGRYDEVTFDENNMFSYDKLGYEVSLEGIGTNREVYLRLTTTSNDETSGYSLTQRYSDETILGKTSTKKINYTGTEKPTEYALFQNYPNPFNPTTTITYQIPKEGLVTLKIYDILGKEVTTLLNEEKQAGKYSIDFNASKLSSGVYLYELRSNEYKSTKKLLLMK